MAEAAGANVLLAIGQGIMGVSNARAQARAAKQEAEYQAKIGEVNSMVAEYQAKDAIDRGNAEASGKLKEVRKIVASQSAAFAASGVDVTSSNVTRLAEETDRLGRMDAMTIKNNAWREAYGYKTQILNTKLQDQMNSITAGNKGRNTIISAGLEAAGGILKQGVSAQGEYGASKASYISKNFGGGSLTTGPSIRSDYSGNKAGSLA